jgi:transposase
MDLAALLPQLAALVLQRWRIGLSTLVIEVASSAKGECCPKCQVVSTSVHSHYTRTVADLPVGGRSVTLVVQVRRFRCHNPACSRHTFAEEFAPLVRRYSRRTALLQELLDDIGVTVGGRPGARFARRHFLLTSRSTQVRLVRRLPLPSATPPTVLGVDDFAVRRNHHYGTLVVDLERHQLLDLWPERKAEPLAGWLQERTWLPDVICRDRGGSYADAARQAAPDALQVADRFHLSCNASDVLERVLVRHAGVVRAATTHKAMTEGPAEANASENSPEGRTLDESVSPELSPQAPDKPPTVASSREARRARRLAQYQDVLALHRTGVSLAEIAQQVGLARSTVRKYVHADGFPEWSPRRTLLRAGSVHTTYLQQRWAASCHDATILWTELCARGFTGSLRMVQRAVAGWRPAPRARGPCGGLGDQTASSDAASEAAPPAAASVQESLPSPPRGLSPQQAVWLLLRAAEDLTDTEQTLRAHLMDADEEIRAAHDLIERFRDLLRTRGHEHFAAWQEAAQVSPVPELRGFVASLQRDEDAVRAALTVDWNSGQVEGQVTKVKLVKRLMFGRANFDLLRRRVLLVS